MTKLLLNISNKCYKKALRTRGEKRKRFFFDVSEKCYIMALARTYGCSYRAAKFMHRIKGM